MRPINFKCQYCFFNLVLKGALAHHKKQSIENFKLLTSRDMLNFDFLEKGLGIVSPPYFMCNFLRNIFFMLFSITLTNQI